VAKYATRVENERSPYYARFPGLNTEDRRTRAANAKRLAWRLVATADIGPLASALNRAVYPLLLGTYTTYALAEAIKSLFEVHAFQPKNFGA
jgi:hypothetical protein